MQPRDRKFRFANSSIGGLRSWKTNCEWKLNNAKTDYKQYTNPSPISFTRIREPLFKTTVLIVMYNLTIKLLSHKMTCMLLFGRSILVNSRKSISIKGLCRARMMLIILDLVLMMLCSRIKYLLMWSIRLEQSLVLIQKKNQLRLYGFPP